MSLPVDSGVDDRWVFTGKEKYFNQKFWGKIFRPFYHSLGGAVARLPDDDPGLEVAEVVLDVDELGLEVVEVDGLDGEHPDLDDFDDYDDGDDDRFYDDENCC